VPAHRAGRSAAFPYSALSHLRCPRCGTERAADEIAGLREAGVAAVFTPGAPLADIVGWLEQTLDTREAQKAS